MLLRYFLHGCFIYLVALSIITVRQPYQRILSLHIRNIFSRLIRDVFFHCVKKHTLRNFAKIRQAFLSEL